MARNLRTQDAAAAVGVAASTLQKWAQQGLVPFDVTAGGHRRFDLDELRRAVRHRSVPPDVLHLRELRQEIEVIARRHRLTNVRIAGSVARGEERAGSDIDFLVDAAPEASLLDVMDAEVELERLIGVPVDVVTSGAANDDMARIVSDAVAL